MALDDGTAWVVGELKRLGREPLDRLLAGMNGPIDNDVALLAVRVPVAMPSSSPWSRRSTRPSV